MYANTSNTIASNISIYPNPASNVINLAIHQHSSTSVSGLSALQNSSITPGLTIASSNSFYSIRIVNTTGSVIKSVSTTQTTWQDNIAALLPGTYIIQVVSGKDNSIVGKATFIKLWRFFFQKLPGRACSFKPLYCKSKHIDFGFNSPQLSGKQNPKFDTICILNRTNSIIEIVSVTRREQILIFLQNIYFSFFVI